MTTKIIKIPKSNPYLDLSLQGKWISLAKLWITDHLPCPVNKYLLEVAALMPTHIMNRKTGGRLSDTQLARSALKKCKAIIENDVIIGLASTSKTRSFTKSEAVAKSEAVTKDEATSKTRSFTKSEAVTKDEATSKKRSKQNQGKFPLSEQLRKAIDGSELSRYRIAKEAGVAQSTISQFMNGKRSLSLKGIDRIAELLDLEIVSRNTTPHGSEG